MTRRDVRFLSERSKQKEKHSATSKGVWVEGRWSLERKVLPLLAMSEREESKRTKDESDVYKEDRRTRPIRWSSWSVAHDVSLEAVRLTSRWAERPKGEENLQMLSPSFSLVIPRPLTLRVSSFSVVFIHKTRRRRQKTNKGKRKRIVFHQVFIIF